MSKPEQVSISIKTTDEYLDENDLTLDNIKEEIAFLVNTFKSVYKDIFPTEITTADIPSILTTSRIFRKIEHCEGFQTHIDEYYKGNIKGHIFTAKVAGYLNDQGYIVTLEPVMGRNDGPHPDIRIEKDGKVAYAECKTSEISNFFGNYTKERVANIIYEKVPTSDQLDIYFDAPIKEQEVRELFENTDLIKAIHSQYVPGQDNKESKIIVNDHITIGVMQKPAIIGSEEDFPVVQMAMFLEDISDGIRHIGYSFLRGGRAIGIWEKVDYANKLKDKNEQSRKQMVEGYSTIVFLDDTDIVGDPAAHEQYINEIWLTEDLRGCSGVVFFGMYNDAGLTEPKYRLKYYPNKHADHPFSITEE